VLLRLLGQSFLDFSSGDQEALHEVLADYFTSPDNADEKDDDDNCMPSSAHSLKK